MLHWRLIRTKILVGIIATFGVGVATAIWLVSLSWQRNLAAMGQQSLEQARQGFANLERNDTRMLSSTLESLLADEELHRALVQKDRESLQTRILPTFARLKTLHGVTNLNFISSDSTRFFAAHDPLVRGDTIKRAALTRSGQTRTFASGKDIGKRGFALRVFHPYVAKDGGIDGYIEIGESITQFLSLLRQQTGADYAIVVAKSSLDENDYAETARAQKRRNNWADQRDIVVIHSTTNDEALHKTDGTLEQLPQQGRSLGVLQSSERALFRGLVPILDGSQKQVGELLVMQDVTAAYNDMKTTRLRLITVMVLMMAVLGLVLLTMVHRLVFRRFEQVTAAATRVVGGEFNRSIPRQADDEVGKIELLLDQFRQVFVNTLDELMAQRNATPDQSGVMATSESAGKQAEDKQANGGS